MKVYLLTVFSFAALVTSTQADLKSAENPLSDITESPKIYETEPKSQQKDDVGIKENMKDKVRDDNVDKTDKVVIPSVDQLTTDNPIERDEDIKKISDPEKKKELGTQLKKPRDKNKDNVLGKFYRAALKNMFFLG